MKCIYLRTNTINGKQYVGQTKDMNIRNNAWNCLKIYYANKHLTEDREKYGVDSFKFEILKECDDSEGDFYEKYYIKKYNTRYPNGYNMSDGGKGTPNVFRSEETKKKISESHKGKHYSPKTEFKKGHIMSKETKEKLSEFLKGHLAWNKGIPMKEEIKKKISESNKGIIKKRKKIYQYTLDGELVKIWESTKECIKYGYTECSIYSCCRGERKTHKGYRWSDKPL